jgi:phosphoserine phosphatase
VTASGRDQGVDLVVQGPSLCDRDLPALLALAQASGHQALDAAQTPAYRLLSPRADHGIVDACAARGLDAAFVPRNRRRDRVRLVAMDMDSTLIDIECIDEIADILGIRPRVSAITASAMRGEIDFRESLVRRVALLAGLPTGALQQVYDERLRLSPGAQRMIGGFASVGAKTMLASGGFTFFTDRLQRRLGLDFTCSNVLDVRDGILTGRIEGAIVDAQGKAAALARRRDELLRADGLVVAIGDGANDVPMLREADVSIAYRAKPVARAEATHALDHCGLDAVLNLFV